MADRLTIAELAEAVADGRDVDWAAVEAAASGDAERAAIDRLKRVHRLTGRLRSPDVTNDSASGTASIDQGDNASDDHARWGHLTILEKVGEGAFGEVYRAHDPKLARDVALKLLRVPAVSAPDTASAIEEGRLLARIRHPNVVTVYGADRIDGRVGLWMEFVSGRTLEQELQEQGPFNPEEVAGVGVDLARALGAVHAAGLVHRDVKAQNVMREDDGRLVLMDFGTGREQAHAAAGGVGDLAGTPLYVAPEVLQGGPATVRSDIYSLGVLLYHLVTGAYPTTADTFGNLVEAHRTRTRTSLATSRPDLPATFVEVVDRAIMTDPAARYGTAREMEAALSRVGPLLGWASARPVVAAALVVLLLAVVMAAAWRLSQSQRVSPATDRIWLVVAGFDNRPGQQDLGRAVTAWFEHELGRSQHVSVVARDRAEDALVLMRQDRSTPINAAVARRICDMDRDLGTVVTGSVEPVGAGYVLTASALNATDGRSIGSASAHATSAADLTLSIRDLAARMRKLLGESPNDIVQTDLKAKNVRVPALAAYGLFREAFDAREHRTWDEELQLVDRAIDADPDFALAHLWRAWCLWHMRDRRAQVRPALARALELKETTEPWERDWIEGMAAQIQQDATHAVEKYEHLLTLNAAHYWTAKNVALILRNHNWSTDELKYLAIAADLRPHNRDAVEDAFDIALKVGDAPVATRNAARMRAIVTTSGPYFTADALTRESDFVPWTTDAWATWLRGDLPEAKRQLDELSASLPNLADPARSRIAGDVAHLYLAMGRSHDAERVASLATLNLQSGAYLRSLAAFWREDLPALLKSLPGRVDAMPPVLDVPQYSEMWVVMLLRAGRVADADGFIQIRARTVPNDPANPSEFATLSRARVEAAMGHAASARDVLDKTQAHSEGSYYYAYNRADFLSQMLLRDGAKDRAAQERAAAELRAFKWAPAAMNYSAWAAPYGMRNLAALADLDRQLGQGYEAGIIEADLRRWLVVAEADYPLARKLRAEPHHN